MTSQSYARNPERQYGFPSLDDLPLLVLSRQGDLLWHNEKAAQFVELDLNESRSQVGAKIITASFSPIGSSEKARNSEQHKPYGRMRLGLTELVEKVRAAGLLQAEASSKVGKYNTIDQGGDDETLIAWEIQETVVITFASSAKSKFALVDFLAENDEVIANLCRQRLPIYSDVAVLMADIQDSTSICAELPSNEYFMLINDFWMAGQEAISAFSGVAGKHAGDGVTFFFLPNEGGEKQENITLLAIKTAIEFSKKAKEIDKKWRLKKNWHRSINVNISINFGKEWVGFFITDRHCELAVVGDSVNQAARLGDYARNGAIWITKKALSELSEPELDSIEYGIHHETIEGNRVWVPNMYKQLTSKDFEHSSNSKVFDILNLTVTEIVP